MIRRRFLFLPALATALRAATFAPPRIFSSQPQTYHGWPTLARKPSGELLLAYSGGREAHVCPYGRVELMRSNDDGESWSHPEVLLDTVIDDRDAGVLVTSAGTILVTTFTSLVYQAQLAKHPDWQAVERRATQAQREALLASWMLRSTDGGTTWSAPYRVPVNSPHGPVTGRGGRLWYPGKQLYSKTQEIGIAESSDDGRTWRWTSAIPSRPGDDVRQYHELHGVETAEGLRIVHIQNHNPANDRETLQTESRDGGRSWSVPHPIGVWGLPSHLLRLRDGSLLMSYGYRRAPMGNHARISRDQGRTWSEPVILSDDGTGDLGYPSTVELSDGRLLTAWYEKVNSALRAVLRLVSWRL